MASLVSIGLTNIRSLSDTGLIQLKPINLLVGKNSAGKSTFARILPLLRQSAEARKREPILWHGRFVDFGSSAEVLTKGQEGSTITFTFDVVVDPESERPRGSTVLPSRRFLDQAGPGAVKAQLIVRPGPAGSTQIAEVKLTAGIDTFSITFGNDSAVKAIKVNAYEWTPPEGGGYTQRVQFNSIFPAIDYFTEIQRNLSSGEQYKALVSYDPFYKELIQHFYANSLVHGNTQGDKIWDIVRFLEPWDADRLHELMQVVPDAPFSWNATAANMMKGTRAFTRLRDRLLAARLDVLLRRVDEIVSSAVGGCSYIEPLRATAERYYRRQGLAVEEVDSKGANLPFFLDSLSRSERESFDEWMIEHLQATAFTTTEGGHLSIKMRDKSGVEANLADVGFGFSQILPIALQLWLSTRRVNRRAVNRRVSNSIIVIEQPELHLHPEYQARIADLCAAVVRLGNVTLILETHSPSLVNRFGLLVANKTLPGDDLQVLRFEKQEDKPTSSISRSLYDAKGRLTEWPYGFFDAS